MYISKMHKDWIHIIAFRIKSGLVEKELKFYGKLYDPE